MSASRWDPFREMLTLREAMQQLMEESFVRPSVAGSVARGGVQSLALDVHEENDTYIVRASLPGARPEDLQVTVLGDTLTIRAERRTEPEDRATFSLDRLSAGAKTAYWFTLVLPASCGALPTNFSPLWSPTLARPISSRIVPLAHCSWL